MPCNVVFIGGVLDTNQQGYIPLEPQEDRLKDWVNLLSIVSTTEGGQWVEVVIVFNKTQHLIVSNIYGSAR